MNDVIPERVLQAPYPDRAGIVGNSRTARIVFGLVARSSGSGFGRLIGHPHPTFVKNTAKNASSTITVKIAMTTAAVVRVPTSSALLFTCMP